MTHRLFLIFGLVACFFPVFAEAIVVGPSRQTIVVTPQTTYTTSVFVQNNSTEGKTYIPDIDAFTAATDSSAPLFGQREEALGWITAKTNQLTLGPGEQGELVFSIVAPQGATPGVHHIGLFAKEQSVSGGTVDVVTRAGSLLFLYVEGEVVEQLLLKEFSVNHRWVKKPAITIQLLFENIGNIHVIPQGEMIIKNWKDKETVLPINLEGKKVLAGNKWLTDVTQTIDRNTNIGKNRIQLIVRYGFQQKTVVDEIVFWYLPWWLIVTGGMVVLCVSILIYSVITRR